MNAAAPEGVTAPVQYGPPLMGTRSYLWHGQFLCRDRDRFQGRPWIPETGQSSTGPKRRPARARIAAHLSSYPLQRVDSHQPRPQHNDHRKTTACGCLKESPLDTLLSLEPRIAGEDLLEPHAEFTEVLDIGAPGFCNETTSPTCYKVTSICIESTLFC
jgi:hypothetical protein